MKNEEDLGHRNGCIAIRSLLCISLALENSIDSNLTGWSSTYSMTMSRRTS